MDTQQLKVFTSIVRFESLSETARFFDVSTSAISRILTALELELGEQLVRRGRGFLEVTPAGHRFAAAAETLLHCVEDAKNSLMEDRKEPSGLLRVSVPPSFYHSNLMSIVMDFSKLYENVDFDLILTDEAIDLTKNGIDVAIQLGPLKDSEYISQRLLTMKPVVVASPNYLSGSSDLPILPMDLINHSCLALSMPGFAPAWRFYKRGHTVTVPIRGRIRTTNAIAVQEAAKSGLGIACLGEWLVGPDVAEGNLVQLFREYDVNPMESSIPAMYVLTPTRRHLPTKTRFFVDYVQQRCRIGPPLLQQAGLIV